VTFGSGMCGAKQTLGKHDVYTVPNGIGGGMILQVMSLACNIHTHCAT